MVKIKKAMKGSAKVKLLNETDEERAVRLEMEALAAGEKERSEQELKRISLRERQLREQRYAHINGIKIHNQWRKIMRLAKVEELRQEIEIVSQNHEREVDQKDAVIQMLNRDLEDAEEQHQTAVRAHLRVVESLLDLQYTRMRALEQEFGTDLAQLQDEIETERADIVSSHARQKKDMQDIRSAMEQQFAEAEAEAKQEYDGQREEIKNRNSEDYNVLKIQLEGIIEELERHFEQAHRAYLDATEHRSSAFRQLTKSDGTAAKVIEKRMRKLVKLQEALQHWRTKIATNAREWEERNRALRNEKDIMTRHYSQLKAAMDALRASQGEHLKQLSISSNSAAAELKRKLARAEAILKLAEVCRRYETEQEKVLPFYTAGEESAAAEAAAEAAATAAAEKEEEDAKAAGSATEEASTSGSSKPRNSSRALDSNGVEVEEWQYLNAFFKRFNKALLDQAAVQRERTRLEQENGQLRSVLKQYLNGISVNEEVMNNPVNPLMIVNQRLQLTLAERARTRPSQQQRGAAPSQQSVLRLPAASPIAGQQGQQQLLYVQATSAVGS